jgi:hypothetical protein
MNKKIVLIAYTVEADTDAEAVMSARSALLHLPSDAILSRFEAFDVLDVEEVVNV